jgi:hypothetical protein
LAERARLPAAARLAGLAWGCALLALATAALAGPDALPAHAVSVVDYDIAVHLDADAKTLDGSEHIVWRNPSRDSVPDIWLHLYLNAFRNSESTFVRESGGRLRSDQMPKDGWGWTDITSIRRADGVDLTNALRFEHPDDQNPLDRTVARVVLPEPVPPGGSIVLDVAWKAKLPRVFARTGYAGDYFLVGQWFPKLGVYEPAGLRGRATGGWNCHQFHANSEFYADFGHYKVAITLPSRFVVGATGVRASRQVNADGSATHVYEQGDVIDFAWTASPHFLDVRRTFSARDDVTPAEIAEAARLLGRPPEELRLGDVEIVLLLQGDHRPQLERHIAAAKAAIRWFGLWYGRYPYPTLTIVDPARGAGGSGGMEYPTFITAGTRELYNRWPFDRILEPEIVVVHEFGHQYWQSMVATNEFEEPWLDEGVNSYSTGKVMERAYGPWQIQVGGLRAGGLEIARIGNKADRAFDRIRTSSWGFSPGNYGFNAYSRTELMLRTLEGVAGPETVARALRSYHERWRFGHPSSDDFFATRGFEPWRGYFAQTVESPGVVDYEVASVATERVRAPEGRVDVPASSAVGGAGNWRSTVLVRRRGEIVLPVDLELRYESGRVLRMPLRDEAGGAWSGLWRRVERVDRERLQSATLDPGDRLVLDVDHLNNSRRVRSDGRAADRWGARWLFTLEQLLGALGL